MWGSCEKVIFFVRETDRSFDTDQKICKADSIVDASCVLHCHEQMQLELKADRPWNANNWKSSLILDGYTHCTGRKVEVTSKKKGRMEIQPVLTGLITVNNMG